MASIILIITVLYYSLSNKKRIGEKKQSYLMFMAAVAFILTSQYVPVGYSGYFSPEQEGHAKEVSYWINNSCGISYSIYEPFKMLSMHMACKVQLEWFFDFLYRITFVIILISSYFSSNLWSSQVYLRPYFILVTLCLIPSFIYGGPRSPLAVLVFLTAFLVFRKSNIKGVILSALSSTPHSVGFLAMPVLFAAKFGNQYGRLSFKNKLRYLLLVLAIAAFVLVLIVYVSLDFFSGETVYIANKNAASYIESEGGNVSTFLGLPRSLYIYPTIFALVCYKVNIFISRGAVLSILSLISVFVWLGMYISPEVSGRFIGFFAPLLIMLTIASVRSQRILPLSSSYVLGFFYIFRSFYDEYQIYTAESLDLLGLPVLYFIGCL